MKLIFLRCGSKISANVFVLLLFSKVKFSKLKLALPRSGSAFCIVRAAAYTASNVVAENEVSLSELYSEVLSNFRYSSRKVLVL